MGSLPAGGETPAPAVAFWRRPARALLRRVTIPWKPDETDVFCGPASVKTKRGRVLCESEHFYVIGNHAPLTPGHLLVIPKEHMPCLAAMPAAWFPELDSLVAHLRGFLRDSYGERAMAWENGVSGQSVRHAHLHLIPVPPRVTALPPPRTAICLHGWGQLRRWFAKGRLYHYCELGGDRRLIEPGTADLATLGRFQLETYEMRLGPDGRATRVIREDLVQDLVDRFRSWERTHPLPRRARPGLGLAA